MADEEEELLKEIVAMELRNAELFRNYMRIFPEDRGFWREISNEKERNGIVLQSAKEYFSSDQIFPWLHKEIKSLKKINLGLDETIAACDREHPSRQTAFSRARELQRLSREFYCRSALESAVPPPILNIFREFAVQAAYHEKRIIGLMKEYGISEKKARHEENL